MKLEVRKNPFKLGVRTNIVNCCFGNCPAHSEDFGRSVRPLETVHTVRETDQSPNDAPLLMLNQIESGSIENANMHVNGKKTNLAMTSFGVLRHRRRGRQLSKKWF